MSCFKLYKICLGLSGASFAGLAAGSAFAQDLSEAEGVGAAASSSEIVVTARKRDETLLSVPVTVAVVTAEQLENRGITNFEGIARTIPQLMLAESSGSPQGGAIGLRGISAGEGINTGDQAVSFFVDNVAIARSTPRRFSVFDLAQIEVLKGPQALYYGKNSPGGVIVIRSADPGDQFEAKASVGYELNANELVGEGFISGPLTDSLGARFAVRATKMRGWVRNQATDTGTIYDPVHRWGPRDRHIDMRGTLRFQNVGPFSARLKYSYGKFKTNGIFYNAQNVDCPLGAAQTSTPLSFPVDECKPDNKTVRSDLGIRLSTGGVNTVTGATFPGYYPFGNGVPTSTTTQKLGSLDLSYQISDSLTLTSTTGYYKMGFHYVDNATGSDSTKPEATVAIFTEIGIREVSEEIRLASDFGGPFDFMIGAYYQKQKVTQPLVSFLNALNPIGPIQGFSDTRNNNDAYSGFVSASYRPIESLEISGGARYSKETKRIAFRRVIPGTSADGTPYGSGDLIPTERPKRSFDNISPEATVTWRPSPSLTLFGGWKRGFLSGGFNPAPNGVNGPLPLSDRSYDDQTVEGFEGGVKSELLNGALRINLAAFAYKISKMQVSSNIAAESRSFIGNAASARSRGVELDGTYRTPLQGLTINGAISYNKAYYTIYDTAPCYGGQSIAEGCNLNLNPAGTAFTNQDLAGRPLVRAPRWGAALGANYEHTDSFGNKLGFSINGNYTSSMYAAALASPGSLMEGYWLLDGSARYELANGVEFAVIGRNLTNKYYFQRSADVPLTGGGAGTAAAFRSDTAAAVSRGREIMLRASVRFR